jgi:sec-independent protein translocase protein TatC
VEVLPEDPRVFHLASDLHDKGERRMADERMETLSEHLEELRRRLIWVILSFILFFIIGLFYSLDIFRLIRQDLFRGMPVNTFNPADPIQVYMQISFLVALVLTSPVALYHVWMFVKPGLRPHERRAAGLYIPAVIGLFLAGLAFGYFIVFPYMMQFVRQMNEQMGLQPFYGVYEAFGFLFNILLPVGLIFELPIVVLFLTRIRLLTPELLRKGRRIAYFVLVIITTVISPPVIISNIIIGVPLLLLYEVSILLSAWMARRMALEDEAQAAE